LRCRGCGAEYSLAEYKKWIDDDIEDELADTRCDRI
jgi:hypothetical protein